MSRVLDALASDTTWSHGMGHMTGFNRVSCDQLLITYARKALQFPSMEMEEEINEGETLRRIQYIAF